MRRANNTGTIVKLKGNRHKPYAAYIHGEKIINELSGTTYRKKHAIGYYATRKEAQDALQTYIMQPYDLTKQNITFIEIWNIIKDNLDISKSRQNGYDGAIKYLEPIKDMPLKDIRTVHLQAIIDDCPVGSATKTNIKAVMNKVFNYGLENDIIMKNYAGYVTFEKDDTKIQRNVYTKDEIDYLWRMQDAWQYKFLLVLLYSGMRPKELMAVKKDDVNLDDGYISITASKTKAGIRLVPIHNKLLPIVSDLMKTDGNYLIQTDRGCQVQYQNYIDRNFKKIMQEMNAKHTLYDTRHTFITFAHKCEFDLLNLQRIVGHKSSTITENVYTHTMIDELKNEINKLEY